jgi:LPXTG-site transpeptidase (sortase) family protein
VEWTSLALDPVAALRSAHNIHSTERWYDPTATAPNNYRATSSITIDFPGSGGGGRGKKGNGSSNGMLPSTGFAPDVVTNPPAQPEWLKYTSMDDMWLEIPNLGLKMPITGVPIVNGEWDLTWLSNQAGYLEGTTYPGQVGTSGITGHVTLADGTPGPFRNLEKLAWGDQIILHANGQRYIYELRDIRKVIPSDFSVFKYDGYTWMTLLTCKDYAPLAQTYSYRTAVRAVLVRIEPDSSAPVDTAAQRER